VEGSRDGGETLTARTSRPLYKFTLYSLLYIFFIYKVLLPPPG
jgi:hypothetical protein